MANSYIQGPTDSTGKKVNTRDRTVGANTVHDQFVIPITDRVATFRGIANTFRMIGIANTAQHNMAYFTNTTGSAVTVAVHDISINVDGLAVAVTQAMLKVWCVTASLPTGGVAATKWGYDSTQSSASNVALVGAGSADGTASAITWTILTTTPMFVQFMPNFATWVGERSRNASNLIPEGQGPILLAPGEHLMMALATTAATGSPITYHYVIGVGWEEFTIP